MQIDKVTVIRGRTGMDKVVLHSDIPDPTHPGSHKFAAMGFLPRGSGVEWVKKTFGIVAEYIEVQ